jgi:hypothetical protein
MNDSEAGKIHPASSLRAKKRKNTLFLLRVFRGTTSSDPTVSSNYDANGGVPTVSTSNAGNITISNGTTGHPLIYTAADGSTSFTGNIRVGATLSNGGASGSELDVTGGSLTITSGGTSTVGYNGSGTIGVSGGMFSINGGDQLWFGNTLAATANVSGTGTFIVGDQFLFSRDGSTATINLSGNGVFDVTGASGTQYAANGGGGIATINIGGNGIFEQTGSSAINLGGLFTVNFGASSLGQFSILNATTATLNSYITAGDFYIAGVQDTTLSDYAVTGTGSGQGIIQLAASAAVPEPSTWAMLLSGVLMLLGVQRFNRKNSSI